MANPYQKGRAAGRLYSYFNRHKTVANLLLVLMLAIGGYGALNIRAQFFPDVVLDTVVVRVNWPGAGAEDADKAIVEPIGAALLAVEGVDSTSARSQEGSAQIVVNFESGWDMGRALEDVKAAVDAVQTLPDSAETPEITRGAWRDRVTDVVISGPVSLDQLGRFADELSAALYAQGISRTSVRGINAPLVEVVVDDSTLVRNDISLREIAIAIGGQVTTSPAGEVANGASRIRTGAEKRAAEDIAGIVVRADADGSKLTVRDVAEITLVSAESGRAYFLGDHPAVLLSVDRSQLGDTIKMQATVADEAEKLAKVLPEGTVVKLINSRADLISDRLAVLVDNGIMGLVLVVALLYLFLGAQTAFWVAAGIPASMMAAIAVMYFGGMTINMMSLFALIITLGIVVDDAIVVGEHADFRTRHLNEPPILAAENAADRMAAPVFSSTITTVLAFLGLVLIGGRFGSLIADIPLTVIAVLLASLVECFLILPNHMRHALAANMRQHWYDAPSRWFNTGFKWLRDTLITRLIRLVIRLRYPVIAGAVLILANSLTLVISKDVQFRFFSAPERGTVTGNIAMLPGATRADTLEMVQELRRATTALAARYTEEYGVDPVLYAVTQVGGTAGRGLSGQGTKDPDQLGAIDIGLIDADLRPYSSSAFLGALQDEVKRLPLLETLSFRGGRFGPGGDSLDVSLFGADSQTLKDASEALQAVLGRYPEVSALEDNMAYDKTELNLQLTPMGEALGFTLDGLGTALRDRLNGITAATYPVGLRTGSIVVQLAKSDLTADFMQHTYLRAPAGSYVPLSDIVSVRSSLGFSTALRENGVRLLKVSGSISEDDAAAATAINTALTDEILPDIASRFGIRWELGGQAQQERDFLSDALLGFSLCLLGIYLALSWIFGSWTRPMIVMAIIPFGLIGTIWGHYAFGVPMSMLTVVGLIGMTGIIINDSIVLVTTIQDFAATRGLMPAVVEATSDRLRPILLTTLTTVLGLAPLLFETSQQAQFLKPTVITLVFGLSVGFLVVLLVVPAMIAVQQDVAQIWRSMRRGLFRRHRRGGLRALVWLTGASVIGAVTATTGYWAITGVQLPVLAVILPASALAMGAPLAMGLGMLAAFAILLLAYMLVFVATKWRRPA